MTPERAELATDERLLVFLPAGQDQRRTCARLAQAGVRAVVCSSAVELCQKLQEGAGAALVAEEVLLSQVAGLAEVLKRQPPWSDIPLLVIASGAAC